MQQKSGAVLLRRHPGSTAARAKLDRAEKAPSSPTTGSRLRMASVEEENSRAAARAKNCDPTWLISGHGAGRPPMRRSVSRKTGATIGVAFRDRPRVYFEQDHHGSQSAGKFSRTIGAVPFAIPRRSDEAGSRRRAPRPRCPTSARNGPPIVLEASSDGVPPRSPSALRRGSVRADPSGPRRGAATRILLRNLPRCPDEPRPARRSCPAAAREAPVRSGAAWRPARRPRSPSCHPTAAPSGSTPGSSTGSSTRPPRGCRACCWSKRTNPPEVDADEVVILSDRKTRSDAVPSSRAPKDRLWIDGGGMAQGRHAPSGIALAASHRQCLDADRRRGRLQRCRRLRRGDRRAAIRAVQAAGRFASRSARAHVST